MGARSYSFYVLVMLMICSSTGCNESYISDFKANMMRECEMTDLIRPYLLFLCDTRGDHMLVIPSIFEMDKCNHIMTVVEVDLFEHMML
jgi:hypothetical protein